MTDSEIKIKIEAALLPYLDERKIDLVEFNLNRYRTSLTVQVIVDIPGGIGIEQCTDANKFLSRLLEETQWIPGDYMVEVSSPGLDRPLKTFKDFRRAIGYPVAVYLAANDLGLKLEYRGILESVTEQDVIIDQVPVGKDQISRKKKNVEPKGKVSVPLTVINKGTLILD